MLERGGAVIFGYSDTLALRWPVHGDPVEGVVSVDETQAEIAEAAEAAKLPKPPKPPKSPKAAKATEPAAGGKLRIASVVAAARLGLRASTRSAV